MIKTASFKLSKQLREAGFPQRTSFYWQGTTQISARLLQFPYPTDDDVYAAPTAEEILERLPILIEKDGRTGYFKLTRYDEEEQYWGISYTEQRGEIVDSSFAGETIAEAAGNAWLNLKENNLLAPHSVQERRE
jgi:hypothetical protein